MRKYLEKIFPVLASGRNETSVENETWHLYDMMNLIEFFIFLMLRTVLNTFFSVCFVIVKFCFVLLFTYAFAFGIFYYFDTYAPEVGNRVTTPKLKRPSDYEAWKENSNKTLRSLEKSDSKTMDENENAEKPRSSSFNSQKSELKQQLSMLKDNDREYSTEAIVRVGSFKRSSAESGQQSMVSRALADLANIETKTTNSKENRTEETLSLANEEEYEVVLKSSSKTNTNSQEIKPIISSLRKVAIESSKLSLKSETNSQKEIKQEIVSLTKDENEENKTSNA